MKALAALAALCLATSCASAPQPEAVTSVDWPLRHEAGAIHAEVGKQSLTLSNEIFSARWIIKDGHLRLAEFADLLGGQKLDCSSLPLFSFKDGSGQVFTSDEFELIGAPETLVLKADAAGIRVAERISGQALHAVLRHRSKGLIVDWTAELRLGSNYLRQIYSLRQAQDAAPLALSGLSLLQLPMAPQPGMSLGSVPGSPCAVPGGNILAAIEEPGYLLNPFGQGSALEMPAQLTLAPGDGYSVGTLLGVFPQEQRRRSFLYYLERERASPSRPYLHYNAWYDLGFNLSDKTLSQVSRAYGEELTTKRGIKLDGFVLDDGWDAPNTRLWLADPGRFPQGWKVLRDQVGKDTGGSLGIWISPCGGYGGHNQRLASAKKLGAMPAETKEFDMGIPGYYKLYGDICRELIRDGGMSYFKWDNAAPFENSGRTFGNLKSTAHFLRLCQLARELRKDQPKLVINATVGTWPSPFWLKHVDCTWRMGGPDVSWIGDGDLREQSLNYRDGEVHEMVIKRAPLYPLNSMMFHGVVLGHHFQGEKTSKAGNHMRSEFRSYFALGTNLQELYLSPDLMDKQAWDDLAEAIRWNRSHAEILVDSHWVQGDPKKKEVYAVAAWRRNSGTLMIRNPSAKLQTIELDPSRAFEVESRQTHFSLKAAYPDQRLQSLDALAGQPMKIELLPFEVLVFDVEGQR